MIGQDVSGRSAYRAGVALAIVTAVLSVWITIVHDDGTGMGSFMVILAVGVGAFAAWFEPAGMARTMLGVAAMQALSAVAIATAPVIANTPDGSMRALLFGGVFATLWLISAAFFRAAASVGHS